MNWKRNIRNNIKGVEFIYRSLKFCNVIILIITLYDDSISTCMNEIYLDH